MNLLATGAKPNHNNYSVSVLSARFVLPFTSASGRSISENCLQNHGWALIPAHGKKANFYPSSPKLEDLEIYGVCSGCWATPCLQASLSGSPHTQTGVDRVIWGSSARRLAHTQTRKMQRFRKIWRWIRSDKKVTLFPAYHPHPVSKLKQEQERKALSLKRFCL